MAFLWSFRLSWHMRSFLIVFVFIFIKSKGFLEWRLFMLLGLVFSEVGWLRIHRFITLLILFFHLKLSSWSFTWCWSWWFFRIKSNLDKLIKRNIWAKTKWNKFKEVIKVFICENSIINALEFAIEINSPFERTYLRPIMISRDNFTNLHLSFLLRV